MSACHARAATAADTDWRRIAELYGRLGQLLPSPVVELNRAVAVGMADGPAAALPLVDALRSEPSLREYAPLATAHADLLDKLGRFEEARVEFERAAAMARNERDCQVLLRRAAACARAAARPS